MPQTTIFSPFFATMLLTIIVWIYMYVRRVSFITGAKLSPEEMAIPGILAQLSPPVVSNPSDNFRNLFEIPVLFYAISLYLFVTNQVDSFYLNAAWIFFGLRVTHSIVRLTS